MSTGLLENDERQPELDDLDYPTIPAAWPNSQADGKSRL
jgi:hypothetical protein